ncbi:MAG: RNA polymerase sigma factor [Phycisphaerales bacterium]
MTNVPLTRLARFARSATLAPADADGERALIDRAKRDPAAFGQLYRAHYPLIAGYLYRRTGDQALAEDLAAETFIAAWRALPRFRHRGVGIRAWLLRIATNQANAAARRARPRVAAERGASVPESTRPAPPNEWDDLHAALDTLSTDHRDVVALVHFESLSVAQAAEVLGVATGTVKSRLARARDALRVELERTGVLP